MIESITALILAIFGVCSVALIVGESRASERNIELKADRTYAWHVLKKNKLNQVRVHDHIYQNTNEGVYDTTEKKKYIVKK